MFNWPIRYRTGKLPTPGVGDLAYTELGLDPQSPIGAGTQNRTQLAIATPLQWQHQQYGLNGLGGLVHGTIVTQPIFVQQG
jgi:hypothetical protein